VTRISNRRTQQPPTNSRKGTIWAILAAAGGLLAAAHHWLDFSPYLFLGVASLDIMGKFDLIPTPILAFVGLATLAALAVVAGEWIARRTGDA
jgi:hypothetical protein